MLRGLLQSPWPYFAGALVLLVVLVASQIEIEPPARPVGAAEQLLELRSRDDVNVIFLLVDTLRADRLGAYGYARPTSPNLDQLAAGGILFERAHSQSSWTKTSMASLWTGTRPAVNGILESQHVIPPEAVLPAEVFRQAGYRTAGIWRNGWVAPNFGFDQGFDFYVKPRAGRSRAQLQRGNPSTHLLQGTDEDLTTSAIEFLDNFRGRRFFLYLHYMDVHQYLYDDKAPSFGTSYSDIYDQSINWVDRLIGHLVEALIDRELLAKTLIVLAADHGEAFNEHGSEGHARNLYEEVIHVPLLLIPPFTIEGGVRVSEPVANIDVWPTALDLVGLELPHAEGRSLVPLILEAAGAPVPAGGDGLHGRALFSQLNRGWGRPKTPSRPLIGVSRGGWQLFHDAEQPARDELYDRARDPGQRANLAAARPEEKAELTRLAQEYLEGAASPWGVETPEVELNEMQLGQLRALGYVVEQ
jgi:arylsulfatase A-like enzyme